MATVLVSRAWTQTAQEIIRGALELCGVVGAGDTITAEDNEICLRALNGVLKELPLYGIGWPKLSNNATPLLWSYIAPGEVSAPDDYFGVPSLRFRDESGNLVPLKQLSRAAYEALTPEREYTSRYPEWFYVGPDHTIFLWPVPLLDPGLLLKYQSIVEDVRLAETPDVEQAYLNGLQYWVASEVALKFGVVRDVRMEIAERLAAKRLLMVQWSTDLAPVRIEVEW